jgi:hypothetical protein
MPALEARQQMLNFFIDTFNRDYLNIYITHDCEYCCIIQSAL